jgi:hypothetical protein
MTIVVAVVVVAVFPAHRLQARRVLLLGLFRSRARVLLEIQS